MQEKKFNIQNGYVQYVKLYSLIINWLAGEIHDACSLIRNSDGSLVSKEVALMTVSDSVKLLDRYNYKMSEISTEYHNKSMELAFHIFNNLYGKNIPPLSADHPIHLMLHKSQELNIQEAYIDIKYITRNLLGFILNSIIKKDTVINRYEDNVSKDIPIEEAQQALPKLGVLKARHLEIVHQIQADHNKEFDKLLDIAKRFNAAPEYILIGNLFDDSDLDINDDYEIEKSMETDEAKYLRSHGIT